MDGIWIASTLALWAVTLGLAAVVLVHSRLIGLLHHRLGPAGAKPLADGPDLGTRLAAFEALDLDGKPWVHRFPGARELVAVFVSPQCQTCNALVPHLKDFARHDRDVDLVLVSTIDDTAMNRAYIAYRKIEGLRYVTGEALARALAIEGTPYALMVGADGLVLGKGVVNSYENLAGLKSAGRASMMRPGAVADSPSVVDGGLR